MREVVKKTKVYKFEELSEEAQQNVIKEHYENEDYPFLTNDIQEYLEEEDKYFSDVKLQYSLSHCQGDGLSFSGKFNLAKWLDDKTELKTSVKLALVELVYNISSTGNSGHYCYSGRSDIQYEDNYCGSKKADKLFKLLEEDIVPDIQDYYLKLCNTLKDYGYSIIEYRLNKDEFSELAEMHEWEYTDNGDLY